jgi:Spy/CpxP family protein refolding chaperone
MLRKVTLGLIAAFSLGAVALVPGAASAHGMHGGWGHGGWGHGHGFGYGGLYINTGVTDCYQQRMVQTRNGVRLRTVNVCAYDIY